MIHIRKVNVRQKIQWKSHKKFLPLHCQYYNFSLDCWQKWKDVKRYFQVNQGKINSLTNCSSPSPNWWGKFCSAYNLGSYLLFQKLAEPFKQFPSLLFDHLHHLQWEFVTDFLLSVKQLGTRIIDGERWPLQKEIGLIMKTKFLKLKIYSD